MNKGKCKPHPKFRWKIVIPALIAIVILYFIASHLISIRYFEETHKVYCYFEKDLPDDILPRHECAILKIVTKDIEIVDIKGLLKLKNLSVACSTSFDEMPLCSGDSYHFTWYPLTAFCDGCNVNGKICGAYYISYHNDTSFRGIYEEGMFTEPNQNSSETIIQKLKGCE